MKKTIPPQATFRTKKEQEAAEKYTRIFENSKDSTSVKLQNFPKYIRRQDATRFLACYEIFKKVLAIKGSIIDAGVYRGFTLMSWALFSTILEPVDLTRRIYGFDTFEGFPEVSSNDKNRLRETKVGELASGSYEELSRIIRIYDNDRFLGHIEKIKLIPGPVERTIPKFLKDNSHLVVSLLFLDLDLYEPTKVAIENFYPRIPKGGIIAFDELDNPIWPGETRAVMETLGFNKLKIQRFEFDPYIGYAIKE